MEAPKLSIIIVSYNTLDMTIACIDSVYQQALDSAFELIVYDNASSDGSAEAIAKRFPDTRLIKAEKNIGFAMGNNEAIKLASGEYVLLLNPDTVVLEHAIDKLMAFARERPDAGIWGGKTLFGDMSLNANSCFGKMTLWNQFCRASGLAAVFRNSALFNSEEYGGWKRDSEREVDVVCGCFLLIKRELWNRLGGFDKKFFMYAEEADLCLRAKKIGFKPVITPEAVIIHYGGGSEKVKADKMVRLLAAKSELLGVHWHPAKRPLGRLMLLSWVLSRIAALAFLSRIKGISNDNLASWKEIYYRRKEWVYGYSGR